MTDYRSPMSLLTCIIGLCVVCAALGYMAGFSSGYHVGARAGANTRSVRSMAALPCICFATRLSRWRNCEPNR